VSVLFNSFAEGDDKENNFLIERITQPTSAFYATKKISF
jgi:hypothetical protein